MTGEYTLNDLKAENEIYTAPVNIYGTKLTRFNLHGSKNLEVGDSMTQEFTYLDPKCKMRLWTIPSATTQQQKT